MENIQTLLAAVAQTQGFDDDPVVAPSPPVKLETSASASASTPGSSAGAPPSGGEVSANAQPVATPPIAAISSPGQVIVDVVKRKRGRPPKGQVVAKLPPPKREKLEDEEEDVCFICFDGGSLVLCDRKGCPKAYHTSCIKRDEAFFQSKSKWNCGWHICSVCIKTSHYMCYTCTYSLCKRCIKNTDYVCIRGNKGFCSTCLKTIMLIEDQANNDSVKVDFDDKTSWEYLFKVYWVLLKEKLSLTLTELTQAKPPTLPLKEDPDLDYKPQSNNMFYGVVNGNVPISSVKTEHMELNTPNDGVGTFWHNNGTAKPNVAKTTHGPGIRKGRPKRSSLEGMDSQHILRNRDNKELNKLGPDSSTDWASRNLLEFVAFMRNGDTTAMSPFGVQALLLDYIKRNNLRDPQQKSRIICDKRLKNLFGRAQVGHIEMLTLLEFHFPTREDSQSNSLLPVGIAGDLEVDAKVNSSPTPVNSRKRKTGEKNEGIAPQSNLTEYAAIDVHNINLIYLRQNLMENLLEDQNFNIRVIGSIVRIRTSSTDPKQDIYRLVQVVGTIKVSKPYKVGKRMANFMLEVLNLDDKEVVSIDSISDEDFTEDECRRLRKSIRCGLVSPLTVAQVQKVAMELQPLRVNYCLEVEISRLNHIRDRASKNGHQKEFGEYVNKLEILKSPEERLRRLDEVPEIHTDPKMSLNYESEEDSRSGCNSRKVEFVSPSYSGIPESGGNSVPPNNRGKDQPIQSQNTMTQKMEAEQKPLGLGKPTNHVNVSNSEVGIKNDGAMQTTGLETAVTTAPVEKSSSASKKNGGWNIGTRMTRRMEAEKLRKMEAEKKAHGSDKPMAPVSVPNSEVGGKNCGAIQRTGLETSTPTSTPTPTPTPTPIASASAHNSSSANNVGTTPTPTASTRNSLSANNVGTRITRKMEADRKAQGLGQPMNQVSCSNSTTGDKDDEAIQRTGLETLVAIPNLENSSSATNIESRMVQKVPAKRKTRGSGKSNQVNISNSDVGCQNDGAMQKTGLEASSATASVEKSSSANNIDAVSLQVKEATEKKHESGPPKNQINNTNSEVGKNDGLVHSTGLETPTTTASARNSSSAINTETRMTRRMESKKRTRGSGKPVNQVNTSNSEVGGKNDGAMQRVELETSSTPVSVENSSSTNNIDMRMTQKREPKRRTRGSGKPSNQANVSSSEVGGKYDGAVRRTGLESSSTAASVENSSPANNIEMRMTQKMEAYKKMHGSGTHANQVNISNSEVSGKNDGAMQGTGLDPLATTPSVENSLSANNIETEKLWHYRDPNGKVKGPFSMMELRIWDTTGLFPPDIRVWRNHEQYDSLLLTDALIGHLHGGSESSCKHSSGSQENGTSGGVGESEGTNGTSGCSKPMEVARSNNVGVASDGNACLVKENVPDSSWPQCWDMLNDKNSSADDVQAHNSLSLPSCGQTDVALPVQCQQNVEFNRGPLKEEKGADGFTQDQMSSGNAPQTQCNDEGQAAPWPHEETSRSRNIDLSSNLVESESIVAPVSNSLDLNKQIANIDLPDVNCPAPSKAENQPSVSGILELMSPAPRSNDEDAIETKQPGILNFPVLDAGPSWSGAPTLVAGGVQLPDISNEWCGYNPTPVKPSVQEWDSALASVKPEIMNEYAATSIPDQQFSQAPAPQPAPMNGWLAMLNEPIVFDALGEDSISDLLAEVDARESQVATIHSPTSAIKFAREFLEDCKDDCFSSIEDFNPAPDPQKCDASGSGREMQLTCQSSCNPIEAYDGFDSFRKSSVNSSGSSEGETNTQVYSGDAGSEFHPPVPNNPGQDVIGLTTPATSGGSDPMDPSWGNVQGNINLVTVQGNVNLVLGGPTQGMANLGWGANPPGNAWANPSINQSPRNGSLPWDSQRKYGGERFTSPRASYQGNEPGFSRGRPPRGRQPYNGGGFSRPLPKGQRVCKFYESGHCKKGAYCDYLHQ